MKEVSKKESKKSISANPVWQIFDIFTLVPTMLASQGDTKLNKPPARPKKSWIQHWE